MVHHKPLQMPPSYRDEVDSRLGYAQSPSSSTSMQALVTARWDAQSSMWVVTAKGGVGGPVLAAARFKSEGEALSFAVSMLIVVASKIDGPASK